MSFGRPITNFERSDSERQWAREYYKRRWHSDPDFHARQRLAQKKYYERKAIAAGTHKSLKPPKPVKAPRVIQTEEQRREKARQREALRRQRLRALRDAPQVQL